MTQHPARPVTLPEVFVENTAWMRRLALTLVRDAAQVDDVLQETWLEWLRRPPRSAVSPRGWLRAVLQNLARKERRAEGRRLRREKPSSSGSRRRRARWFFPPPDTERGWCGWFGGG